MDSISDDRTDDINDKNEESIPYPTSASVDSLSQSMSSLQPNNHFYHHSSPRITSSSAMSPMSPPTAPSGQQMAFDTSFGSQSFGPQMPYQTTGVTTGAVNGSFNPQFNPQAFGGQSFGPQMPYGVNPAFPQMTQYYNYSLSQYYSDYYQNYYKQWMAQHQRQHQSSSSSVSSMPSLRQPLKYGSHKCHARAAFSQHNNTLLVIDNTGATARPANCPIVFYSLCDLFVDYLFPKQMFHLLLRSEENHLPFESRDACLQWIRCKQQLTTGLTTTPTTGTTPDYELKLILRVIQMLLRQNSRITGLDLSELLLDLIDSEALNKSLNYSENDFSLNEFRILLMRGQKTVALNHALSPQHNLWSHALCLSFLMQAMADDRRRHKTTTGDDLMLKTVRKFCETLRPNDPISVFYNSVLNWISGKHVTLELSFESFLILLSNEMNLKSIEVKTNQFKHLLDLIKSLQTTDDASKAFLLSDELFDSELDSILINECLEFSRFAGNEFNERLIEKKTFCDLSSRVRRVVYEIESRFDHNLSFDTTVDDTNDDNVWTEDNTQLSNETTPDVTHTTPEHIPATVQSSTVNESSVEPIPLIPSDPQEAPPLDYYSQFGPPSLPPSVPSFTSAEPQSELPVTESLPNGDIPFSFVSSAPPSLPSMTFNSNINSKDFFSENGFQNDFNNETTDNTTTVRRQTTTADTQKTTPETSSSTAIDGKSGQSSGFLSKFFNLKPKNQAILPDDSKMTLIWDKTQNRWIDTSSETPGIAAPPLRPPPVGPPAAASIRTAPSGGSIRNRPRYVDITRQ